MPRNDKIYYCYIYLNPLKPGRYTYDDIVSFLFEPFYVGKGKGVRIDNSLKESCNTHKYNTVLKIKRNGDKPLQIKLASKLSNLCAACFECFYIQAIGRANKKEGPLTNWTKGGDGVSGFIPTQEQRARHREAMKGINTWSKGRKNPKQSDYQKQLWQDPNYKEK